MNFKLCIWTVVLIFIHYSNASKLTRDEKEEKYRLKNKLKPLSYEVDLTVPDTINNKTEFLGHVFITVKVDEDTNIIRIHQHALIKEDEDPIIKEKGSNSAIKINKHVYDNNSEIVTVTTNTNLEKNKKYSIDIKYTGTLRDDMYGFYRSSYVDENEEEQWIATTQFESTHARSAFPCFDEPALKATFKISITHSNDYKAISNAAGTPEPAGERTKTVFETTPPMSTYLVAFVVHKFADISGNFDKIDHSLFAPTHLIGKGQFAFGIAPKVIQGMKEYTDVSYEASKLSKLAQIAIPDFSAGAMENWGLVTYRETALLWDQVESSLADKESVATIVAHEFAHMWFGDLITCDWWSVTWLNEGFATYFEYINSDKLQPDWDLKSRMAIDLQQNVFVADSVESAQALTSDCYTTSEIDFKFGTITYNKGASVIRMIANFIGEDKFKTGIQKYFSKDRHFKTATPDILWTALESAEVSNLPASLKDVMQPWTEKSGFPVVKVALVNNILYFEQNRFFYDLKTNSTTEYYVPISLTTNEETQPSTIPKLWLLPGQANNHTLQQTPEWVVINVNETGYYRVQYSDELYEKLANALNQENFSGILVLNRAQIVDDVLNLARAGYVTYDRALKVLDYLSNETDYHPWTSSLRALTFLKQRIDGGSELAQFLNNHILNLMSNALKTISFEDGNTNHIQTHKRVLLLRWACNLGQDECIAGSNGMFNKLKDNNLVVDSNIRNIVYCTAMKNAENDDVWNYLWNKFRETKLATETVRIITALGCSNDTEILKQYLEKSITENSGIKRQDAQAVFNAVINGNTVGVNVALTFLKEKFDKIFVYYGGVNGFSKLFTALANQLTVTSQVESLKAYVNEHREKLEHAAEVADDVIKTAETNIKWTEDRSTELLNYFQNNKNSGSKVYANYVILFVIAIILSKNI